MRQCVFLNFFACRLCWKREASCRNGFLSLSLGFFGQDSWAGLHLADLRMILLPGKIHRCHINIVFKRRQTDDLRSLSPSCHRRRNPTIENVDTFFFTQPDPFVRVFVKRATLSQLGIHYDWVTFTAHHRC